jgi:hypothetical protein
MAKIDSIAMYKEACESKLSNVSLDSCYVTIIAIMFYELMRNRKSELLSLLCSSHNIDIKATNFHIIPCKNYKLKNAYDLLPIIDGLNTAFSKDLALCGDLYSLKYEGRVFTGDKIGRAHV